MSTEQSPYKISNFIHDIVKNNIIQFNKTELSCGRTSSYYADFRMLLGYPELSNYVVSQIIKVINAMTTTGSSYDNIAGVAVAGVPWATLVGNKLNKPVSIIRLSEKTHGKKAAIDGAAINIDNQVILIEDVLTSGTSVINAIRKIHNTGAVVTRVICILDRNEGAQEHIKYYYPDVKVSSILSIDTIVSFCSANKLINDYLAEQIEFYRESGYTETTKMLTRLNENAKEMDYQKETVKWHFDNFANVWNLPSQNTNAPTENVSLTSSDVTQAALTRADDSMPMQKVSPHSVVESQEHNPLFVDVSNMDDWNEIKYKISVIGQRLRNLVIKFENIRDWNGVKQDELFDLHKKMGFNIIYKSAECIPHAHVTNTTQYTLFNMLSSVQADCKYPNSALLNGIILNLYVDTNPHVGLVTQLREAIAEYEQCNTFTKMNIHNIFINFIGPGVTELIPNNEFWQEFRSYILSIINNQLLQIKGIIIPYTYVKANTGIISRKVAIGRLMPLILDTSYDVNGSVFYLEPSMLTNNTHSDYVESQLAITKAFNSNGFTHLMVGNDLMESNTVITERIIQYINFVRSICLLNQKNAFTFIQMSNALAQHVSSIGSKTIDIIKNKVNAFTEQLHAQATKVNNDLTQQVNTAKSDTTHTGVVAKCREYLLTYTNKMLGVFGFSLVVN